MNRLDDSATLILFCGLPGSGKTTLAKNLEEEGRGVRLNTDEWMADLGFSPNDETVHIKLQRRLWVLAKKLLQHSQDVILEDGLWMKHERDIKRREAADLGVSTELHYLKVPLDELVRRLGSRNREAKYGHAFVSREEIEKYYNIFEDPDSEELKLFNKVVVH